MGRGPRFIGYIILLCISVFLAVLFVLAFGRMDQTVEFFGAVSPC
jgi:hypothetical protein